MLSYCIVGVAWGGGCIKWPDVVAALSVFFNFDIDVEYSEKVSD